uniref:Uncharacterized protein n=1 Tax=Rhizophora mucronata TaxID=61149 RepID=A0A2P2QU50_RHIMU
MGTPLDGWLTRFKNHLRKHNNIGLARRAREFQIESPSPHLSHTKLTVS